MWSRSKVIQHQLLLTWTEETENVHNRSRLNGVTPCGRQAALKLLCSLLISAVSRRCFYFAPKAEVVGVIAASWTTQLIASLMVV